MGGVEIKPGEVVQFFDGNGMLPDAWYGEQLHVLKVVGAFVIFERLAEPGSVYGLPVHCVW